MAYNRKQTPIPVVPATMKIVNGDGTVTRSGQLLLEQLQDISPDDIANAAAGLGPFVRTLDLVDLTPGTSIAPLVPIFQAGQGIRCIGVLRKTITADLVVTIKRNTETSPLFTFTLPHATPIGVDVIKDISTIAFKDLDVLIPNITASDSSSDIGGVATITIEWGKLGTGTGGGGSGGGGSGGGGTGGGFIAGGDLAGTSTSQTVIGLEGVPLDASTVSAPANGQVLTYDAPSGRWKAETPTGGGGGGGTAGTWEVPTGTLNGTNTTFTLSATPATNSLLLFMDGVEQEPGTDYTLSGATITYTVAPLSTDWHLAYYDTASGTGGGAVSSVFGRTGAVVAVTGDYTAAEVTNAVDSTGSYANPSFITSLAWSKITGAPSYTTETPSGTMNGTNTSFTLTNTPISGSLTLFLNGVEQVPTTDFTISGTTITYAVPPRSADLMVARYAH